MIDLDAITVAKLLRRIEKGWNELQAYIGALNDEQLSNHFQIDK